MKLVRTAAAIALASAATVVVTLFPAGQTQADITWGVGADQGETVQAQDITWGFTGVTASKTQAKDITWG